tara:strand:- start:6243 stop:7265 length:1023 start_codon:yes stop_codon:yes gene_type:complete
MKERKELIRHLHRKRSIFQSLPSIKSIFAGKNLILLAFLILFISSVTLYARFEFAPAVPQDNIYFEAFYWMVTTATTVGYGDITPQTIPGKILALVVMVLGVSMLGYILSQLTKTLVSANIGRFFGLNRVKDSIDYIICGWNDIAQAAFEEVNDFNSRIIIISENRPDIEFSKNVQYMDGDPHDRSTLENANVSKAKNIMLCMNNDSKILLAIHVIRELNPWTNIIAKMNDPGYIPMAESAGADQTIAPAALAGRLLSIVTKQPYVVKWFLQATSVSMHEHFVEYPVQEKSLFVNKTIADIRRDSKLKIIGIESGDGFEKLPSESYTISPGDKLIVMVSD